MQQEAKNRVIAGLDEAFKALGAENLEQGMALVSKLFQFLHKATEALKTREAISACLDQMEEPSPEEQTMFLAIVENLPELVRLVVQMGAAEIARDLPHPPGGRPALLDGEQRKLVCEFIGKLHVQGVELAEAKRRAAQKFGVSERTVERTWLARREPVERKYDLEELIRYLGS